LNTLPNIAIAALLALLVAPPVQAASTTDAIPVTLDQLMASLRSVRHVSARYIEHRYLHVLRTPLETRGTLHFDAPAHLEKTTDPAAGGASERLTIDGDQLTIDRGGGTSPVVVSLREHPEIGILADSIRATLSGDGDALRRNFDITPSGTLGHWQLVLQPREAAQHALLQWMRISGYTERITVIETADGEGDRSEMTIVEQTP
jgi:Outer membrane lipoprotein carrier protein LolA-like